MISDLLTGKGKVTGFKEPLTLKVRFKEIKFYGSWLVVRGCFRQSRSKRHRYTIHGHVWDSSQLWKS